MGTAEVTLSSKVLQLTDFHKKFQPRGKILVNFHGQHHKSECLRNQALQFRKVSVLMCVFFKTFFFIGDKTGEVHFYYYQDYLT